MHASRVRVGALIAFLVMLALGSLVSPLWAGEVTDCDRLAASPQDPARIADGVAFAALDAAAAVPACKAALAAAPGEPRLAFQLGRALIKAGEGAAGLASYEQAAAGGSLAALHNIGALYAEGQVVAPDLGHALRCFLLAAEHGFAPSQFSLGLAYLAGHGVVADEAKALTWIRLAAEQDYAPAIEWLAQHPPGSPQARLP